MAGGGDDDDNTDNTDSREEVALNSSSKSKKSSSSGGVPVPQFGTSLLKTDAHTVFVSNIAYSASADDLSSLFSTNVGPVKKAFLVTHGKHQGGNEASHGGNEKASQAPHKGVGFVTFALAEHATLAAETMHGTVLHGRRIRVNLSSTSRAPLTARQADADAAKGENDQNDQEGEEQQQRHSTNSTNKFDKQEEKEAIKQLPRARELRPPTDPAESQRGARTLVLGGFGTNAKMRNAAMARAKALDGFAEWTHPLSEKDHSQAKAAPDGCPYANEQDGVALAVFKDVPAALSAVKALHLTSLGTGKASKASKDAGAVLWARQLGGEGKRWREWRLIVRNITWKLSASGVADAIKDHLKEGKGHRPWPWRIDVPTQQTEATTRSYRGKAPSDGPRIRGFAFVAFTTKVDATRALESLNGGSIGGRPVAADWAVGKEVYEKSVADGSSKPAQLPHAAADEPAPLTRDGDVMEYEEQDGDGDGSDKDINFDDDDDDDDDLMSQEEDEEEEVVPNENNIASERTRVRSALDSFLDDAEHREADGKGQKDKAQEKGEEGKQPAVDKAEDNEEDVLARTLFVRCVPSTAQRYALRQVLEAAAAAGASIASGSSADAASAAAALVRASPSSAKKAWRVSSVRVVGGQGGSTAFAEFADPRGAEWALCAPSKEKRLGSVQLQLARALSGNDSRRLASRRAAAAGAAKGGIPVDVDASYLDPTDRRRMKLLEEGVVSRGMPAAEGVCDHDLALRERLEEEKKLKLRSPYFRVSDRRLAVHNIPRDMTKTEVRRLFLKAVSQRAKQQTPEVVQVSLLQEKKEDGTLGKSMGRGFVEFKEHQHAMAALRELNNNPEGWALLGGLKTSALKKLERRPIVGFAVDDVRKLQVQAKRASRGASRGVAGGTQDRKRTRAGDNDDEHERVPKSNAKAKRARAGDAQGDAQAASPKKEKGRQAFRLRGKK